MKKFIVIVGVVVVLGVIFLISFIMGRESTGRIEGKVTDALSGDPVYKVTIVGGGKSTTRYMDDDYFLTGIEPGRYTLKATAPAFADYEKEVEVKRGLNLFDIKMKGTEIPDLKSIILWAEPKEGEGVEFEIRFVNSKGEGIVHFPRLDLKFEGKLYYRIGTKDDYTKGDLMFEGPVELFWDSTELLGKNKGLISKDNIEMPPGEGEKFGVLEGVLQTPHGDFTDTDSDVSLKF